MKKLIIGVAAAFLAIAAPTVASADSNAVVAFTFGNGEPDGADDSNFFGLSGGFSHDMMNGWTMQVDGAHHRVDNTADLATSYAAVGVGMRNDQYSIGAQLGMDDFLAVDGTTVALNGQMYFSQAVLNGSVSYATQDDFDVDLTHFRVDGTWFFNDNLGLNAVVGHTEVDSGGGGDDDYNTYGIGGEYRFADSPYSIGVGWQRRDPDAGDIDTWNISFTMDLGTSSLSDRARHGPSWSGAHAIFEEIENALLF